MKYIIDIPDDGQCQYRYNEDTKELKFPCPRLDPNSFMGLDITISGATPYTEPDRKAIEDEVWEFAEKRFLTTEDFGATMGDSYSEAKAKYDAWEKSKEEIHVGDEVIPLDTRYDTMVVTKLWTSVCHDEWVDTIAGDGKTYNFLKTSINKTGRHFDEVDKLLERIKEE